MNDKQKTPIQKALDRVSYHGNSTKSLMNRETLRRLRVTLENLLDEEKFMIKQAFVDGSERGTGEIPFNCDQYFTQNFEHYDFNKSDCESL